MNINMNDVHRQSLATSNFKLDDLNIAQLSDFSVAFSNNEQNGNKLYSGAATNNSYSKNNNFLIPGSSSSNSDYESANSYETPNSIDTPLPSSSEFLVPGSSSALDFQNQLSNNHNNTMHKNSPQQQQQQFQNHIQFQNPHQYQFPPPPAQQVPVLKQQHEHMSTNLQNQSFMPESPHRLAFHERNRSEVSELASPSLYTSAFFDEGSISPIRSANAGGVSNNNMRTINPLSIEGRGNLDDVAYHHNRYRNNCGSFLSQLNESLSEQLDENINNYLNFAEFGSDTNANANANANAKDKNDPKQQDMKDLSKIDLSSLGIEIKPTLGNPNDASLKVPHGDDLGDVSFSINESFFNEILNDGGNSASNNANNNELAKDILLDIGRLDTFTNSGAAATGSDGFSLLPAFLGANKADKVSDNFLDPNSLASLRNVNSISNGNNHNNSSNVKNPNTNIKDAEDSVSNDRDYMDEGDTTIMNSTSLMELNEPSRDDLNTSNFMDELHDSELISMSPTRHRHARSRSALSTMTPSHSRTNSKKLDLPKLKSFHNKSPTLGSSPNRVGKFSHSTSFKSIPTLNEKLSFIDEYRPAVINPESGSPVHGGASHPQNFTTSVPSSPTRNNNIYLAKSGNMSNSYIVKTQSNTNLNNTLNGMAAPQPGGHGSPVPMPHMMGPAHPMYYTNFQQFPQQTPPASPTKAMSGLTLTSPAKLLSVPGSSLSTPFHDKNSFTLKPTPNGRKRVATSPRSKTGCWTCRIRHKKCDEGRPVCKNCSKISLKCDQYYDPKPLYMTDKEERKRKLAEIAHIWKNRSRKGNKDSSRDDGEEAPDDDMATAVVQRKLGERSGNKVNSESPSSVKKSVVDAYDGIGDKENVSV